MPRSILFAGSLIALALASGPSNAFSSEALPQVDLTSAAPVTLDDTGTTLELIDITDQRCPAGVECYWEGMIRVELRVEATGMAAQTVVLCNLCEGASKDATVGDLTLTLIGLAPSTEDLAQLGRPPELGDYDVTVSYFKP